MGEKIAVNSRNLSVTKLLGEGTLWGSFYHGRMVLMETFIMGGAIRREKSFSSSALLCFDHGWSLWIDFDWEIGMFSSGRGASAC